MAVKGEHEFYCCGARLIVSDNGIKVLSEPLVDYCPLHETLYGVKSINADAVKRSVEFKIASFGFCCQNRALHPKPIVPYGASEMIQFWLNKKFLDCAVVVCEGAGTVITTNGNLVQAIGARLTGIIRTTPIREVMEKIRKHNGTILDETKALIDQAEGVRKALDLGFKSIAVTVAGFQSKAISEIRNLEEAFNANVIIYSICNTCIVREDMEHIAKADIVCASASKIIRGEIGKSALMQLGVTIPVFVLTDKGKRLVLTYLAGFQGKLVVFRTSGLPYEVAGREPTLKSLETKSLK